MKAIKCVVRSVVLANRLLDALRPLALLAIRFYVAKFFFVSGLNKFQSWQTTVWLFEEEYSVPLLSPEVAAFLGTAGELILPVLLVFGLMGRFSAVGLFFLNIVAVATYPALWDMDQALMMHLYIGLLAAMPAVCGPGALSVDWIIVKCCDRFCPRDKKEGSEA